MNLTPEQEFEARASTLSREELCLMAKELWCEMASLKQLLRDRNAENVRLKDNLQVVAQMRQAQKALLAKHNEDNLREVNRLQSAVDYRLAELGVKAV
jgi:arginine deiminase